MPSSSNCALLPPGVPAYSCWERPFSPAPAQPWGHRTPQGSRKRCPTAARHSQMPFGIPPGGLSSGDSEVGEGCWWQHPAQGTSVQPGTGARHGHKSSGLFIWGQVSLCKAFCSSLLNPSLTSACSPTAAPARCPALHTLPLHFALRGTATPGGPFCVSLHLPDIKPGLFSPKREPCEHLFCRHGSRGCASWAEFHRGPGQVVAPSPAGHRGGHKRELLPGMVEPRLANTNLLR